MLNRPDGGILKLAFPANGRRFAEAYCGEIKLDLRETANGYEIALPQTDDGIDTVIRLC